MSHKTINKNKLNLEIQSSNLNEKLHFCFMHGFSFQSTTINSFTNFYKDKDSFLKFIKKLFEVDIPNLSKKTFNELKSSKKHYHKIENNKDDKKRNMVINIIKKMLKSKNFNSRQIEEFINQNILDTDIYQLGLDGGVRVIGIISGNIFEILFFDVHHLIYPSEKHNDIDYESLKFSLESVGVK